VSKTKANSAKKWGAVAQPRAGRSQLLGLGAVFRLDGFLKLLEVRPRTQDVQVGILVPGVAPGRLAKVPGRLRLRQ
jgi:hypothetical protein